MEDILANPTPLCSPSSLQLNTLFDGRKYGTMVSNINLTRTTIFEEKKRDREIKFDISLGNLVQGFQKAEDKQNYGV